MARFIIRPARAADALGIKALVVTESGMTSLPKDDDGLHAKIQRSLSSFAKSGPPFGSEYYLFVLEDQHLRTLVGISAIGFKNPGKIQYRYCRLVRHVLASHSCVESELQLEAHTDNPVVMCSYLMRPEYRAKGLGRFLSLCRFAYMSEHPERFSNAVIAEMRGAMFSMDHPLFWECFAKRHFGYAYAAAYAAYENADPAFLAALQRGFPIPLGLLPRIARDSLGRVYPTTRMALRILKEEGFASQEEMDFFDAGPIVRAQRSQIRAIRDSSRGVIASVVREKIREPNVILARVSGEFRAVLVPVRRLPEGGIAISRMAAAELGVGLLDEIRVVTLKTRPAAQQRRVAGQASGTG